MNNRAKKHIKTLALLSVASVTAATFSLSAIYLYLSPGLPSVESIRDIRLQTPLQIYSTDGALIGEFGEKRRQPVKLEHVPQPFIDALLAAEDAEFYSHSGVSFRGLARAVTELLLTGERGSGGSTLTMQLTRNVFLSLDRKFIRKFNEILLSLKLERELSKDEILELYVNYMFLGKRAYGIQAAAEVYYGKELHDLSLAQLAMIAGLFKGPSTLNPIVNPTRALERRNWILERMYELNKIDKETLLASAKEPVSATYHGSQLDANAPYVAEMARENTLKSYGNKAYTDGYKVYTTVNASMQIAAQKAIFKGLMEYDQRHGWRGAEQNLINSPHDNSNITTEQNWENKLSEIDDIEGLIPAAVLSSDEMSARLLVKGGLEIELTWEQGLQNRRPYITENSMGSEFKTANEFLNRGDVVRVIQQADQSWRLSQLPKAQAAIVALDPHNGAIRAIVGGFSFHQSNFNRATQAHRQPGSNFKPFLYTSALESGMTAATLINDSPIVFDDQELENTWRPKNDSNKFMGDIRLRRALYRSINLVSIRMLQKVGINNALKTIERFGFDTSELPRDLSLALGTYALPPIDLVSGWAVFANGGHKVNPHIIERITDKEGNIIYQALPDSVCANCEANEPKTLTLDTEQGELIEEIDELELPIKLKRSMGWIDAEDYPKAQRVVDEQVIFIMDDILKDVIRQGTGRRAQALKRHDLAGKTGTTNGPTDTWFSGYNADIVATAWVGFDDNSDLGKNEFGSTLALPIWMDFMAVALKNSPDLPRKQPNGIVTIKINPENGERARANDPDAIFEYFRQDNAPKAQQNTDSEVRDNVLETFAEDIF